MMVWLLEPMSSGNIAASGELVNMLSAFLPAWQVPLLPAEMMEGGVEGQAGEPAYE